MLPVSENLLKQGFGIQPFLTFQGGKTLCQNLFYHCFALENEVFSNNPWGKSTLIANLFKSFAIKDSHYCILILYQKMVEVRIQGHGTCHDTSLFNSNIFINLL